MIGRVEETSASFEARSAPRLYPTERLGVKFPGPTRHGLTDGFSASFIPVGGIMACAAPKTASVAATGVVAFDGATRAVAKPSAKSACIKEMVIAATRLDSAIQQIRIEIRRM
jgi:hypothetical protein